MLRGTGATAIEWWTGGRPADRVMRDAALARLAATNATEGTESSEVHKQ